MPGRGETNVDAANRLASSHNWSPSQWADAEAVHFALHNIVAMDRYADTTEHRALNLLGEAIMREADNVR